MRVHAYMRVLYFPLYSYWYIQVIHNWSMIQIPHVGPSNISLISNNAAKCIYTRECHWLLRTHSVCGFIWSNANNRKPEELCWLNSLTRNQHLWRIGRRSLKLSISVILCSENCCSNHSMFNPVLRTCGIFKEQWCLCLDYNESGRTFRKLPYWFHLSFIWL